MRESLEEALNELRDSARALEDADYDEAQVLVAAKALKVDAEHYIAVARKLLREDLEQSRLATEEAT